MIQAENIITCFKIVLQYYAVPVNQDFHPFSEYEIAQLLSKVRHTSSGLDDLPYWLFQKCSFELAGIVTSLLNKSFSTGTVPSQWLAAVVTPVPKKSSPTELSDYLSPLYCPDWQRRFLSNNG